MTYKVRVLFFVKRPRLTFQLPRPTYLLFFHVCRYWYCSTAGRNVFSLLKTLSCEYNNFLFNLDWDILFRYD